MNLRPVLVSFLLVLFSLLSYGQGGYFYIRGKLISSEDSIPVRGAKYEVIRSDSFFVGEFKCSEAGDFEVGLSKPGNYSLKFHAEGYKSVDYKVSIVTQRILDIGYVLMSRDAILLKVVTVQGIAKLQVMKGDTVLFNPAALSLTANATLNDIIGQIPGLKVEDGNIVWQGKNISQILVNGQEFFGNNKSIALNYLPANAIANVKVYDKESEFTEHTGIEDGQKKTVLDVTMKKKYEAKWIGNVKMGGGTQEQYEAGGFASRFSDRLRTSALVQTTSRMPLFVDMGSGRLTASGTQEGFNHNQNYAAEMAWNNGGKVNRPGYLNVNVYVSSLFYDQQTKSEHAEETFLPQTQSVYSLGIKRGRSEIDPLKSQINLKWQIDSLTYCNFKVQFNSMFRRKHMLEHSAVYNTSPYQLTQSPFPVDELFDRNPSQALLDIAVNRNEHITHEERKENQFAVSALLIRRFGKKGRSLTWNEAFDFEPSDSHLHSLADIRYYSNENVRQVNRQYAPGTARRSSVRTFFRYSEPFSSKIALIAGYGYTQGYERENRPLYQLDSLGGGWADGDFAVERLPGGDSLRQVINFRNSVYSTRYNYNHAAELKLSYTGKLGSFTAGLVLRPERSKLDYKRDRIDTAIVRDLCYVAPNFYFKRTLGKKLSLDANYSMTEKYPDLLYMLDITDDTDPLNIIRGNPDLRPSWTHKAGMNLRFYHLQKDISASTYLRFSTTDNDVSKALYYNTATGVRTLCPKNVDGNCQVVYGANTDFKLDSLGYFRLNPSFNFSYRKFHGLVSTENYELMQSRTSVFKGEVTVKTTYKKKHTRLTLWGELNWERVQNTVQSSLDQLHYIWEAGSQQDFRLPLEIYVESFFRLRLHRGYTPALMNYTDLVWDVTLGRSFLKSKRLSTELYWSDILQGQNRRFYSISGYSSSYRKYTYLDSFCMLTLTYKLSK